METPLSDGEKEEIAERVGRDHLLFETFTGHVILVILVGIVTGTMSYHSPTPPLIGIALDNHDEVQLEQALIRTPNTLESTDKGRRTPFISSVWKGDAWAVDALIRRGANVHARMSLGTDRNCNAFHVIAANGRIELAELLLNAGVDINEKTKQGKTPLDIAVERHRLSVAKFLRDHGGKPGAEIP